MRLAKRSDIAAAFGIIGFLTAIALVTFGDMRDLRYVWVNEIGVVAVAGPSAWLAGLMCARLFGLPGGWGWVVATIGAVLVTFVGGMIGGTLVIPGLGTIVAPFVLFAEGAQRPAIAIVWLASMATLHTCAVKSKT